MNIREETERLIKKYGKVETWSVICKASLVLTAFRELCGNGEQTAFSYNEACWIDVLSQALYALSNLPNSGVSRENSVYKEDNRMLNESSGYDYVFGTARFHFHEHEEWSMRSGYEGTDWYLTVTQDEQ